MADFECERDRAAAMGLVVRFELRPGCAPGFDDLTAATLAGVRRGEPGTLLYVCHSVEDDPSARVFYELYRNREAFEEHERQPHVRRFLAEREQYLASTRVEFLALAGSKGLPLSGGQ